MYWLAAAMLVIAPAVVGAKPTAPKVATITSGGAALSLSTGGAGITVRFGGKTQYASAKPLQVQALSRSGQTRWFSAAYTTVAREGKAVRCQGKALSTDGTTYGFTDIYGPGSRAGSFTLDRQVRVTACGTDDQGFCTRFSLACTAPPALKDREYFIPGILYRDNGQAFHGALAADLTDEYLIVREDRMALPLVMMRDPASGQTVALIHTQPNGATSVADYDGARVVDGAIHVGALGVYASARPAVAFYYPACEGLRSYLPRGASGWCERFHPVTPGFQQQYHLAITVGSSAKFAGAIRSTWRTAYALDYPGVAPCNVDAVYTASMKLIMDWSRDYNGCEGLPFRLRLPEGKLEGEAYVNYQMGFIGQQIPLGYHLIHFGLLNHDDTALRKGEATLDLWASRSLTPEGLPRTWFDVYPQPHWRAYNTFLRVASDGMCGALRAWQVERDHGRARPEWLRFCRGFGDWLVNHQNPDGSWYREYDFASNPVNRGKLNSTHPIRFLVDLAAATGDARYRNAALRAGEFCWVNVHQAYAYVGGTPDNPNVIDKEAGVMALQAFLALYDASAQKRWLTAAAQAADFTETWQYAWSVPIPHQDKAATWPRSARTTGLGLIATGHSGADLFLAVAAYDYYRLYRLTNDRHYRDFARQLLYDCRTAVDIDGSLGYGHTGLCTEAISIAVPRGRGVDTWLPWLSYNMIDPITRLQDTYGGTQLDYGAAPRH